MSSDASPADMISPPRLSSFSRRFFWSRVSKISQIGGSFTSASSVRTPASTRLTATQPGDPLLAGIDRWGDSGDWLLSSPEGVISKRPWKTWHRLLQGDPNDPPSIVKIMTDVLEERWWRAACSHLHCQRRGKEVNNSFRAERKKNTTKFAHENSLSYPLKLLIWFSNIPLHPFFFVFHSPQGDWRHERAPVAPAPSCRLDGT